MSETGHRLQALILEDSEDDARLAVLMLERQGYVLDWQRVDTEDDLLGALERGVPDVILADHAMPRLDSARALDLLDAHRAEVPFILVSGTIGEEVAVDVVRRGASDYVSKGNLERLGPAIERARGEFLLRQEHRAAQEALRESEARYRALFENAPDAIVITEGDRIVDCNARAPELFGLPREAIVGRPIGSGEFSPRVQPDGTDSVARLAQLRDAALGGEIQRFEWEILRGGGETATVHIVAGLLPQAGRTGMHVILRDISDEKAAERALAESEAKYRRLFDDAPNGIFLLDEARFVDCNESAARILGYGRDELVGMTPLQLSPEYQPDGRRSRDKAFEHIRAALGGTPQRFEWEHIRKDGSTVMAEVSLGRLDGVAGVNLHAILTDVTAQRALESREREQYAILHGISEGTSDVIFVKDPEGRYIHINAAGAAALGRDVDQVLGCTSADLFPPEQAARIAEVDESVLVSGEIHRVEERLDASKGQGWYSTTFGVCRDANGDVIGTFGIARDVTEERRKEAEMRTLSRALQQSADAIIITDARQVIEYVNPAFERITGYAATEAIGRTPDFLASEHDEADVRARLRADIHAGREFHGVLVNRRRSGELYYADMSIAPVRDEAGAITHFIASHYDITDKLRTERELAHLVHFDPVTDLPNRSLMIDRLEHLLSQTQRFGWRLAVMQVDLDGFGLVNESWGKEGGDHVLRTVGRRLVEAAGADMPVGRIGNDGFVALALLTGERDRADGRASALQQTIGAPIHYQGEAITVTGTIGLALAPDDSGDAEELLRHAETALHRAQSQGREQIAFYAPAMSAEARHWLSVESGLRRALENSEFRLEYQPQVDLHTGRMSGVEALLRWDDPERGPVSPGEFVPLLETTGLIVPVGEWVIREACRRIDDWHAQLAAGDADSECVRVAVNLSLTQFERRDLVTVVREALEGTGADARCLELELTESSLARNPDEATRTLQALRELGVSVALDDFGVGYSSLNYLKRFPIDVVKVDRMFVDEVTRDPGDAAILRAVLELARSRGMKTIAEGVETDEQVRFLLAEGCRHVQGFHFSRPLAPERLRRLLGQKQPFTVDAG